MNPACLVINAPKMTQFCSQEEREIVLSVQEALSMIAPAYHGITGTDSSLMETLILSNLEKVKCI